MMRNKEIEKLNREGSGKIERNNRKREIKFCIKKKCKNSEYFIQRSKKI